MKSSQMSSRIRKAGQAFRSGSAADTDAFFLGLSDPDPLLRGTDLDPDPYRGTVYFCHQAKIARKP